MRNRTLVALPVVLLLSGCGGLAATDPKPAPAASDHVIPWIDAKPAAYHQGLAVPLGGPFPPTCKAEDLTAAYAGAVGLTNGQMAGSIDFANVSSTACVLEGIAAVDLFGAKGATLSTTTYTNTQSTVVPIVLQPVSGLSPLSAGHASVEIDWSLYDEAGGGSCPSGLAQAAAIGITVPGDGTLTTSAVSPRNDGPITFCPPRIGIGAFQRSAPVNEFSAPPGPVYFQATMKAPATAVVGRPLNYQVTLKSVYSRPLTFPNGCPAYVEDLGGPGGWSLGKTWHLL